ncbi:hypothetical protein BH10ACT9_BH10ACT9_16830 [soil metagenome]
MTPASRLSHGHPRYDAFLPLTCTSGTFDDGTGRNGHAVPDVRMNRRGSEEPHVQPPTTQAFGLLTRP